MLIEHIIYLLSIFELTVFYTARVVTQPASISDAICGLCKFKTLLNLNFNKIMMNNDDDVRNFSDVMSD